MGQFFLAIAAIFGGLSVGVPGDLRGWEMLHKRFVPIRNSGWTKSHTVSRHGTLPWADLVAPAIKLARNGFTVNVDLAAALQGYDFITQDPLWAETYAPNGTVLVEGDICYRKVCFHPCLCRPLVYVE